MLKLDYFPERYPYGNCIINTSLYYLRGKEKRFEAAFQNTWGFSYDFDKDPQGNSRLNYWGMNESIDRNFDKDYLGLEVSLEYKNSYLKSDVINYLSSTLKSNLPPVILIDGYYDYTTNYANVFHKLHDNGHGRFVIGLDEEKEEIYYSTTDPADPEGEFLISFNDFFLGFKGVVLFNMSDCTIEKHEVRSSLKEYLEDRYYINMFDRMYEFSDLVLEASHVLNPAYLDCLGLISNLFYSAILVIRERHKFLEHINYIFEDEPSNIKIKKWIEDFNDNINQWEIVKNLFNKYSIRRDAAQLLRLKKCISLIASKEKILHEQIMRLI